MTCPVHGDTDAERTEKEEVMASSPPPPLHEPAKIISREEMLERAQEVFDKVLEGHERMCEELDRYERMREGLERVFEEQKRVREEVLEEVKKQESARGKQEGLLKRLERVVQEEKLDEEWRNTVAIPVSWVLLVVAVGLMCYGDHVSRWQTLATVLGEFPRPKNVVGEVGRGMVYGGRAVASYVMARCVLVVFGKARPRRGDDELSTSVGMMFNALVLILVGRFL
jgi:hypothetical protein